MPGPLSHLTILDLSRVLAGPWCTQLLADLGATVLKIERPGSGDDTRAWGPPFLKDAEGRDTREAAYYLGCNRGKRSLAIDFTKPEGRDLVLGLARQSDALVENFKVRGLAKYGLDYASVATVMMVNVGARRSARTACFPSRTTRSMRSVRRCM